MITFSKYFLIIICFLAKPIIVNCQDSNCVTKCLDGNNNYFFGKAESTNENEAKEKAKSQAINLFIGQELGLSTNSTIIINEKDADFKDNKTDNSTYQSTFEIKTNQKYFPIKNLTFSIVCYEYDNKNSTASVCIYIEDSVKKRIIDDLRKIIENATGFINLGISEKDNGRCQDAKISFDVALNLLEEYRLFIIVADSLYNEAKTLKDKCSNIWDIYFSKDSNVFEITNLNRIYNEVGYINLTLKLKQKGYVNIFLLSNSDDEEVINLYPNFKFNSYNQNYILLNKETEYNFPFNIPKKLLRHYKTNEPVYGYPIKMNEAKKEEKSAILFLFSEIEIPEKITNEKSISGLKKAWEEHIKTNANCSLQWEEITFIK